MFQRLIKRNGMENCGNSERDHLGHYNIESEASLGKLSGASLQKHFALKSIKISTFEAGVFGKYVQI